MAIAMACPSCGARLEYRDDDAGRAGQCPTCKGEVRIPFATKMCVGCRRLVASDAASCPGCGVALGPGAAVDPYRPAAMVPFGETATSGKAVASLVLGLASFLAVCFTGIPALIFGWLALRDIRLAAGRLTGQGMAIGGMIIAGVAMLIILPIVLLIALMIPFLRFSQTIQTTAFTAGCQQNLQQIGLALHSYHDAHGSFPPVATLDAEGKPLLSWRVLILPYLGPAENALYQQFRLDEPWDSPSNLPLADQMPAVFRCLLDPGLAVGATSYLAISGPGSAFPPDHAVKIGEISDGTSNTIMVAETAGRGITWTKPEDVVFDERFNGKDNFNSNHEQGWHVLFVDGSVRLMDQNVDPKVWRKLVTIHGGEPINPGDF